MKTLYTIIFSMMFAISFPAAAGTQEHDTDKDQSGTMMDMMSDPGKRSMVMENIAQNPEMRHEMMQKIMQSVDPGTEMDMHGMMKNPAMQERMKKHMGMMRSMMNTDGMNQEKMHEMMSDPEMMAMMQKHMMCSQMMDSGMMDDNTAQNTIIDPSESHSH